MLVSRPGVSVGGFRSGLRLDERLRTKCAILFPEARRYGAVARAARREAAGAGEVVLGTKMRDPVSVGTAI